MEFSQAFNYKNATNFWFLLYCTKEYFGPFHGFIDKDAAAWTYVCMCVYIYIDI